MQGGPSIWIGYDSREAEAFTVCRESIRLRMSSRAPISGLILRALRNDGLYYRPTEYRPSAADKPVLWDVISDAPMSTEFAISRFLVPTLAKRGWALFMDCDMLALTNVSRLFDKLDPSKAAYCVKHRHDSGCPTKMDGQLQQFYARKNWSSFMVFNCEHPSNKVLTVEMANTLPGRDLHRFCWLKDEEIGELDPSWNFLVGYTDPAIQPKIIHWTSGGPWFKEYENVDYADVWLNARDKAVA